MGEEPKCQLCQTVMVRKTVSNENAANTAAALIVMAIGIAICCTGIGAILGVPICICALFIGGGKKKFLVCPSCGMKVPCA